MKNYDTPILKEEKVEIEDIVAASLIGDVESDRLNVMDKLHNWGKK